MIASMMMYARPELEGAHSRLWTCIRSSLAARGIDAPAALSQSAKEFDVWEDPSLVLSQTCGMPYRTRLQGTVRLVGTPDYGLEGCAPGFYRSAIVVRADDNRAAMVDYSQALMAFNMTNSQSGFAAMYAHVQPSGFWFANRVQSGGHLRSAHMVAGGQADIAALDAQTWRLIERYEAVAAKLRVLEYTAPKPGLPYITGSAQNAEAVFDAVHDAFGALTVADAKALDLQGLIPIQQADYLAISNPPASAML